MLLLSIAASLALVIGLASPANAAWTRFYEDPGNAAVLACKKAVNGGFGPVWEIHLVAASGRNYRVTMTVEIRRGGTVVSRTNLRAARGAWAVKQTHASRIHPDRYYLAYGVMQLSTGYGLGQSLVGPTDPASLRTC